MSTAKSKPKNNVTDLLAAIARQPTSSTPEKATADQPLQYPETKKPARQETAKKITPDRKSRNKLGKPVQFWMYDDEIKLVRELSAWLAGQGIRASDSMVIRAVLRAAKTGSGLLDAYTQAAKLDGRVKHD